MSSGVTPSLLTVQAENGNGCDSSSLFLDISASARFDNTTASNSYDGMEAAAIPSNNSLHTLRRSLFPAGVKQSLSSIISEGIHCGAVNEQAPDAAVVIMESDKQDYVNMLPPEIWKMIADRVGDVKSLENMAIASPVFREVLLDKRCVFLAPAAIKLVAAKGYFTSKRPDVLTGERESDLPSCYAARRVCKAWSNGVDARYEERYTNPRVQFSSKFGGMKSFYVIPTCKFLSNEDVAEFNAHFEASHQNGERNPFLGRAVDLFHDRDRLPILTRIFTLYGQHVWGLRFDNYGMLRLNDLYEYLSAMPNLRRFEIRDFRGYIEEPEPNNKLGQIVLPALPNLTTFKSPIDLALQSGILLNQPTIKNLQLKLGPIEDTRSLTLPNVEQLKLVLQPAGGLISFDTVNLRAMTIHWKDFGEFQLSDKDDSDGSILYFQVFFDSIHKNWGRSILLKEFELELPSFRSKEDIRCVLHGGGRLRLELKNVEEMKLLMHHPCSLDFLMPMKNTLRNLRVKIQCQYLIKGAEVYSSINVAKTRQVVQFVGFEKQLYKSNMWNMFPKLQEVFLEGHLSYETKCYYFCGKNRDDREFCRYTRSQWIQTKV